MHIDRVAGELRDEVRSPALHRMRLESRVRRGRRAVGVALLRDDLVESIGASAGSQTTILVLGISFDSTRETPLSVPPVPKPVTQ